MILRFALVVFLPLLSSRVRRSTASRRDRPGASAQHRALDAWLRTSWLRTPAIPGKAAGA